MESWGPGLLADLFFFKKKKTYYYEIIFNSQNDPDALHWVVTFCINIGQSGRLKSVFPLGSLLPPVFFSSSKWVLLISPLQPCHDAAGSLQSWSKVISLVDAFLLCWWLSLFWREKADSGSSQPDPILTVYMSSTVYHWGSQELLA